MPLKVKETNISNEHNRLENPNWREADQLAIYKHDRGVELGLLVLKEQKLSLYLQLTSAVVPVTVEAG